MSRVVVAVAALLAVASPASAAPRQKVAVLDVRAVQGVSPGTATILTAIIAGDTSSAGYDVLSQADIGALIGFERQKKMLGCGDDSSCLAEIGGALGAEYVLSTQVGQIGSRFHLSLQLLDAKKGFVVSRVSTFSETTEDALAATAQRAVAQALAAAKERAAATGRPAAAATPKPATSTPTSTSTSTSTPTATPTATSTPTPTSTATPSDDEGRRFYVELRAGLGWNRAPIPTSSKTVAFDGPALGIRAGLALSRTWAVEAGGGWRKYRHTSRRDGYFDDSSFFGNEFDVLDEVRGLALGVGPVYSPPALRWVSFAADAGAANVRVEHERSNPTTTILGIPPAVNDHFEGWVPRLGVELRVDVPVRWVTVGLRAGVDLVRLRGRRTVRDPFSSPTASSMSSDEIAWLDTGWLVSVPIDLSVRYVF